MNNGPTEITRTIEVRTLPMEKPGVDITLDATKDSITYSYDILDNDSISQVESVKLYYGNKFITENLIDHTYSGLFSNSMYKLVVTLLNDYHDGKEPLEEEYYKEISTESLADIDLSVILRSDKRSVYYDYNLIDLDGVASIKEVRIYKNNGLVATSDELKGSFKDLLSNNEYRVEYVVEKDFRDNNDPVTVTFSNVISTTELEMPSLDMEFTSTADSIDYIIHKIDNDNCLTINHIDVYNGSTLVTSITDLSLSSISSLKSNTNYTIKVFYSYNLNDGNGTYEEILLKEYSTLSYDVEIISYQILNEYQPKTNEIINLVLNLNNKSNVKINYLVINGKTYKIAGGNGIDTVIIDVPANPISGIQVINIEKFGYIINGVIVEQKVIQKTSVEVKIASRVDPINIITIDNSLMINLNYQKGYIITFDNPNDYKILSITISLGWDKNNVYELTRITQNEYYLSRIEGLENYYKFKITNIKYQDDKSNIVVRNVEIELPFNFTFTQEFNEECVSNVNFITTPEELLHMEEGKYYELANDIDMSSYVNPDLVFRGLFNGKGHTISNLRYYKESETSVDIYLMNGGCQVLTNVYFKDFYISLSAPNASFMLFGAGCEDSSFISDNILLTGDVVTDKNTNLYIDSCSMTPTENVYIVDHLNINKEKYNEWNFKEITNEQYNDPEFRKNTFGWDLSNRDINENEDFRYKIVDDKFAVILSYLGTNPDLVIPETIDGLKVIGIDEKAFENNEIIQSLKVEHTLYYVGGAILKNCPNLTSIDLYDDLGIMFGTPEFLFSQYNNYYDNILSFIVRNTYNDNSWSTNKFVNLEKAYAPNGVNEYKFVNDNVKDLYISSSVNCISTSFSALEHSINIYFDCSFKDYLLNYTTLFYENFCYVNDSRFNVYFKENGEYRLIGDTLTIPNEIKTIKCNNLNLFKKSIKNIIFEDGSLLNTIDMWAFAGFELIKNIEIPSSVTYIGRYAFNACSLIENIEIPNSVTYIGNYAFSECENLKSVKYSSSIDYIPDSCFENCHSLNKITNIDTIKEFRENSFAYTNFDYFIFPESCEKIYTPFACEKLSFIYIPEATTCCRRLNDCIDIIIINQNIDKDNHPNFDLDNNNHIYTSKDFDEFVLQDDGAYIIKDNIASLVGITTYNSYAKVNEVITCKNIQYEVKNIYALNYYRDIPLYLYIPKSITYAYSDAYSASSINPDLNSLILFIEYGIDFVNKLSGYKEIHYDVTNWEVQYPNLVVTYHDGNIEKYSL